MRTRACAGVQGGKEQVMAEWGFFLHFVGSVVSDPPGISTDST